MNRSEDPLACAIREVKEETSYDCSHLISANDFIEREIRGTKIRLYIIPGVDEKEKFAPVTRCEIKNIEWFNVNDIKSSSNNGNSFFMAQPFVKDLKEWIKKRKALLNSAKKGKNPGRDDIRGFLNGVICSRERQESTDSVPDALMPPESTEGVKRHEFITKHWLNVKLDWDLIWQQVDADLRQH